MSRRTDHLPAGRSFQPLARLELAEWNPRIVDEPDFQRLLRSLRKDPAFLVERPPLVADGPVHRAGGLVYGGNQRVRAVLQLFSEGWQPPEALVTAGWWPGTVPVSVSDVPEDLARARAAQDNNHAGRWDEAALPEFLFDLDRAGFDADWLGFPAEAMHDLFEQAGLNGDAGAPLPPAPEAVGPPETDPGDLTPPAAPMTQPGDLWRLDTHRLLCGDATDAASVARLLDGARPRLMVTDPPYGVEYEPGWRNDALGAAERRTGAFQNDARADWRAAWQLAPADVAYVWHAGRFGSLVQTSLEASGFEVRAQIIWAKPRFAISRGHYHWQHEPCLYVVRKGATADWQGDRSQTTLWKIDLDANLHDGEDGGHGTQKPLECMERPVRHHAGDVYDPFLGSGTTLIAAARQGRTCYALDLEPGWVDVAVRRWERYTGRAAVRVPAADVPALATAAAAGVG